MSLAKNSIFLYSANMLSMVIGYVFWVIVTKLTGSESADIIGVTSSAIALSTLFATLSLLGIPGGIQRFIGKYFFEKDFTSILALIKTSMIIVFSASLSALLVILSLGQEITSITMLSWEILVISTMILVALAMYQLMFSVLVAVSGSRYLFYAVAAQGVSRILIMIALVYSGFGLTGLLISYFVSTVISIPIMLLGISSSVRSTSNLAFVSNAKKILKASSVHWLPTMISTIGGQISVLVVISYSGSTQAGEYYIASIIFSAVIAVPLALISTAFPMISGMIDQSRTIIRKVIKVGLMFSVPLAVIAAMYSTEILNLLDPSLANASILQSLFMMAVVPTILNYGFYYLLYAHGKYRNVLAIGIADNLSKVIFYFVLVPQFGSLGAAMAFIIGPYVAFLFIQLTQHGYLAIPWRKVLMIILAPTLIGLGMFFLELNPFVSIAVILSSSFYVYIRFAIIDITELREMTYAILPAALAKRFYPRVEFVAKAIGQTVIFSE